MSPIYNSFNLLFAAVKLDLLCDSIINCQGLDVWSGKRTEYSWMYVTNNSVSGSVIMNGVSGY